MSRADSPWSRLRAYETNLIEDVVMSSLIFLTITAAWGQAPDAWPQIVYYLTLAVGLFGYFMYVSPPPNTPAN